MEASLQREQQKWKLCKWNGHFRSSRLERKKGITSEGRLLSSGKFNRWNGKSGQPLKVEVRLFRKIYIDLRVPFEFQLVES